MAHYKEIKPTILNQSGTLALLGRGIGTNTSDIGFVGAYEDAGTKYAAFFRDTDDSDKWKLINGATAITKTAGSEAVTGGSAAELVVGTSTAGNLSMSGNSIISTDTNGNINLTPDGTGAVVVPTPTGDTHAATKGYVDSVAQGLDIKASVVVGTTTGLSATASGSGVGKTLTNNGAQAAITIDGVVLTSGERILVKNGTGTAERTTVLFNSADSGGDHDGKYWTFSTPNTNFYVWYTSGAGDPAPGGTGIQVTFTNGASAATLANLTAVAINSATNEVNCDDDASATITLENRDPGSVTDAANVDLPATAPTFTVATEGVAASDPDADNGIYTVTTVGSAPTSETAGDGVDWVLTRATDADEDDEVTSGMFCFVEEGTTNADTGWVLSTDNPITVDTTTLSFTQFSGAGSMGGTNLGSGAGVFAQVNGTNLEFKSFTATNATNSTNAIEITNTSTEVDINFDQLKITGTGALDAGSISTNFGNIDNGSSTITTTGTITGGTVRTTSGLFSATTSVATFAGATTGSSKIVMPDSQDASLTIENASGTDYLVFDTTAAEVEVAQTLKLSSGFIDNVTTINTSSTLTAAHSTVLVTDTSSAVTLTLPTASSNTGKIYKIIFSGSTDSTNDVTVDPATTDAIDGVASATFVLTDPHDHVMLVCAGADGWYTF
jgi:hypothetical protein